MDSSKAMRSKFCGASSVGLAPPLCIQKLTHWEEIACSQEAEDALKVFLLLIQHEPAFFQEAIELLRLDFETSCCCGDEQSVEQNDFCHANKIRSSCGLLRGTCRTREIHRQIICL
mmetsp:Transcript_795/g.762  ORF Transcript_795/g.762 Transcript_795/m.762 type:complete len:116 (-) Transcript_795:258-605(-)